MEKKKIIAAGHICLDITPVFPPDKPGRPEELLVPGRLLHMDGVEVHTGGSVANTGLAMKKLGADVRLMGKIGDDAFGKIVLDILSSYGCDGRRDMIISPDAVTSYTVVLAIPGTDRIFLHTPSANDSFSCDDLDFDAISRADHFHFGYPPLMRRMYENGGRELIGMFRRVKSMGLTTSLDMAEVDPTSDAGQADWKAILTELVPLVDHFLPSAEELCFMLDRPRYDDWLRRAAGRDVTEILDIDRDIKPLADMLSRMGAHTVVIKCGAPGLYYRSGSTEGFQPGYKPERLCSATGAGDTAIAAFLLAMLEGRELTDCVRLAAAEGAACVAAYDALSGLKTLDELDALVSG